MPPWSLDYPAILDRHERDLRRESELDDLYRQQVAITFRRVAALSAMREANAVGNNAAWHAAAELHDRLSDELAPIMREIFGLEEDGGGDLPRGLAAMYFVRKL